LNVKSDFLKNMRINPRGGSIAGGESRRDSKSDVGRQEKCFSIGHHQNKRSIPKPVRVTTIVIGEQGLGGKDLTDLRFGMPKTSELSQGGAGEKKSGLSGNNDHD